MNIPIKLIKMSQTFVENKIDAEGDKNECCICYNDDSEEGNEGKLIECCPNKHILCVGCFHKSYERKCECPLCRELMYRPEIMTDVEAFAYFGAKVALNDRRAREAERIQRIQRRNDELLVKRDEILGQIAINNAEIENINNLDVDAYYAMYSPYEVQRRSLQPNNIIISDSDTDTDDDSVELIYEPQPRPERIIVTPGGIAIINQSPRPVQQPVTPVARPVQQPARPVARPVQQPARPVQINLFSQPVAPRPVQQPVQNPVAARTVQQPVQNPVARPVTTQEQIQQLLGRPVQQPVPRPQRPVQERRSSTYAYEKLVHNEVLVQTLRGQGMVVRYDRLNDRFIRVSDNSVYPTLNRASAAHALEVGLATTPNAWTTFKRLNGSSIDNL